MFQCILTPAAGKRLIARAVAAHEAVRSALESGTVVIVAGTTNGYVAEELLQPLGQAEGFARNLFFRGIILPNSRPGGDSGPLPDRSRFPGDVVFFRGAWQKGKTIFDIADRLEPGDVILKGANAVDLAARRAAVLVGDPRGGTILAALGAAAGGRARLILPVGVEKRVVGDLDAMALRMNPPAGRGPRLLPVPGEILTELDAIGQLTGCVAEIAAGGGVCGAEGAVWLAVSGDDGQEASARRLIESVVAEPPFNPYT
ncbi:MAG: hypothetical protein JXP48_11590 [Acidobacteria bacterium]|nr:hypothetical protein [Acidobacteriota bacterium]